MNAIQARRWLGQRSGNNPVLSRADYESLPGFGSGWFDYLRPRLHVGFLDPQQDGQYWKAEKLVLTGGVPGVWAEDLNLWRRGASFFTGARMIACHPNINAPPTSGRPSLWLDQWEHNRLRHRMTDPINMDRFITANMNFAIEACLKALASHCYLREEQQARWLHCHDVRSLFEDLPKALRIAIASASRRFAKAVQQTRDRRNDMVRVWTASGIDLPISESIKRLDAVRQEPPDFCVFSSDILPRTEWLQWAIGNCSSSVADRYSPQNASPDPYSTELVIATHTVAWFLYDYLFPFVLSDRLQDGT